MIKFTRAQFAKLGHRGWERFEAKVVLHLRQDLPDWVAGYSDGQLVQKLAAITNHLEAFNIVDEYDIVCVLDASLILEDDDFLNDVKFMPIKAILNDSRITTADRAEQALTLAVQRKFFAKA